MKVVSQQAGFNLWLFQNSSEERTPTGGHKEGECLSLENSTRATTRESIYKLFTKWKQEAKLKDIYTLAIWSLPFRTPSQNNEQNRSISISSSYLSVVHSKYYGQIAASNKGFWTRLQKLPISNLAPLNYEFRMAE